MNNFYNSSVNIPEPEGKMDTSLDCVNSFTNGKNKQVQFGKNTQVQFGKNKSVQFGNNKPFQFGNNKSVLCNNKKVKINNKSNDKSIRKLLLEQIRIQQQLIDLLLNS